MTKFSRRTFLATGAVLGVMAVGVVSGSAIASSVMSSPADGKTPPSYQSNDSGLTYGSAIEAVSPESEPDLILVVATNGREGYSYKTELDKATGAIDFKSPEEAIAWQEANAGPIAVPVYEKDGKTVIGEFVVGQR